MDGRSAAWEGRYRFKAATESDLKKLECRPKTAGRSLPRRRQRRTRRLGDPRRNYASAIPLLPWQRRATMAMMVVFVGQVFEPANGNHYRFGELPHDEEENAMRRYLFGPVSEAFADQSLYQQRLAGQCLAFDAAGSMDLKIGAGDSWECVTARVPEGWRPEFIVLYLPYTSIPACLWSAPVPIVGLAADWNLLWHHYRHCLRRCDLVLADKLGGEVMAREGIGH